MKKILATIGAGTIVALGGAALVYKRKHGNFDNLKADIETAIEKYKTASKESLVFAKKELKALELKIAEELKLLQESIEESGVMSVDSESLKKNLADLLALDEQIKLLRR